MDTDTSGDSWEDSVEGSNSEREYIKKNKGKRHDRKPKEKCCKHGHHSRTSETSPSKYMLKRKFRVEEEYVKNKKSKRSHRSYELEHKPKEKAPSLIPSSSCPQMPPMAFIGLLPSPFFPQYPSSSSMPCNMMGWLPPQNMKQCLALGNMPQIESSSSKRHSKKLSLEPRPSGHKSSKKKSGKKSKKSSPSKRNTSSSSGWYSTASDVSSSDHEKRKKKALKHHSSAPMLSILGSSTPVENKNQTRLDRRIGPIEQEQSSSLLFDEPRIPGDHRRASLPFSEPRSRSFGYEERDSFWGRNERRPWRGRRPFGRGRGGFGSRRRPFERRSFGEEDGGQNEVEESSSFQDSKSSFSSSNRKSSQSVQHAHEVLQTFQSEVGFIDSHCHLDMLFQRADFEGTHSQYKEKKGDYPVCYKGCITVFCDPASFKKRSMWRALIDESDVWGAFGCHPHHAEKYDDEAEEDLEAALDFDQVVALGEIGLDYSNRNNCNFDQQKSVFRKQLRLLKKLNRKLPVIIHCREAHDDCFSIVKEEVNSDQPIHLHCFTDGWDKAQLWLDTFPNLYIGVTNLVTNMSASEVKETVRNIPLSRLLIETDAPYFVPMTLKFCEDMSNPGMAIHVAAEISKLKHESLKDTLETVMENTKALYNI